MKKAPYNDIFIFNTVVQTGTFKGASEKLENLHTTTVSRTISQLENDIGKKLFVRHNRGLCLTEFGKEMYLQTKTLMQNFDSVIDNFYCKSKYKNKKLKLFFSVGIGLMFIERNLENIQKKCPDLELEVITYKYETLFDNALYIKPIMYQYDIAIFDESYFNLISHANWTIFKIFRTPYKLFASKSYLDKHGTPTNINELSQHECICTTSREKNFIWELLNKDGSVFHVHINGKIATDVLSLTAKLVTLGFGIALLPKSFIVRYLDKNTIVNILPDYHGAAQNVALIKNNQTDFPEEVNMLCDIMVQDDSKAREKLKSYPLVFK